MKPNWDDINDSKERKNRERRLARRAHDTKHSGKFDMAQQFFTWVVQSQNDAAAI